MLTPYSELFPDSSEPVMTMTLGQKFGKAAKGEYTFLELYCTDPGCDCRRVTILVATKGTAKAFIDFGFDPDDELAGPFLNDMEKQSAAAADLLELFVYQINNDPDWLKGMYQRYKMVRAKVDGRAYRGKPFPKPGSVVRVAQEPPDLSDVMREFSELLSAATEKSRSGTGSHDESDLDEWLSVAELVEWLAKGKMRTSLPMDEWERMVWVNFMAEPDRLVELAELLPRIIPHNSRDEERLMTALQLLRSALDMMRHDLECQRPGAQDRLEQVQSALARHVYTPDGDLALCSQVTRALLESRQQILPVLREASHAQLVKLGGRADSSGIPVIGPSLGTLLRRSGCQTPFEGVDNLLDLLVLLAPELQIALFGELLDSRDSFVRDTAALMLFHPTQEVREGVAALLASGSFRQVSPETLRRLIISRNWFPVGIRKHIDEVITAARRGGVVCARLAVPPDCVIQSSTIDGAGAQSFFIVSGEKKRKTLANILWKQGHGVIDAFVSQTDKQQMEQMLHNIPEHLSLQKMAPAYLDLTVNHALAVGVSRDKPPHLGLLQVAEALGCDRWKAEKLDPKDELAELRQEMEATLPHLLTATVRKESLWASGMWPERQPFADTWFEDDARVDDVIKKLNKGKRQASEARLEKGILEEVLEPSRMQWLELFTFMTLWLRHAEQPPVPWHQMFHAAEALTEGKPLKEHDLMVAIAEVTLAAALERAESARMQETVKEVF